MVWKKDTDETFWSAWFDDSPAPLLDTATGFPTLLNVADVGAPADTAAPFPSPFFPNTFYLIQCEWVVAYICFDLFNH